MIEFVNIDIYLNCVVFAVGIDEKEFDQLYEDNKDKFTDEEYKNIRADIANEETCNGLTCELDGGNVFMYIRKGQERKDLVVSHEIFHTANKILCRAGVHHDSDAEPWAYLIGWLTNEYYNRLDDYEKELEKPNDN